MEINELVLKVENGEVNPLDAYIELHSMSKQIDSALKSISQNAYSYAENFSQPKFEYKNRFVELGKKSTYSYKHIQKWVEHKEQLSNIEEAAKQAYIMTARNLQMFDEDGEIITPAQCAVTTFLKISERANK